VNKTALMMTPHLSDNKMGLFRTIAVPWLPLAILFMFLSFLRGNGGAEYLRLREVGLPVVVGLVYLATVVSGVKQFSGLFSMKTTLDEAFALLYLIVTIAMPLTLSMVWFGFSDIESYVFVSVAVGFFVTIYFHLCISGINYSMASFMRSRAAGLNKRWYSMDIISGPAIVAIVFTPFIIALSFIGEQIINPSFLVLDLLLVLTLGVYFTKLRQYF